MRAVTCVEAVRRPDGVTVLSTARCEPPLLVRQDGDRPAGGGLTILLLGGAAGPLGGDDLELHVSVAAGAVVRVRSVAAMLAQPGPSGAPSAMRTVIHVGEGASLDWEPEPLISVRGSRHTGTTVLHAAADATVRMVDAVLLGRHGEESGVVSLRQRVEVAGRPVLDHDVVLGEAPFHGPGAHGPLRMLSSTVVLGPDAATTPSSEVTADAIRATYPLAARASLEVTTHPTFHSPS